MFIWINKLVKIRSVPSFHYKPDRRLWPCNLVSISSDWRILFLILWTFGNVCFGQIPTTFLIPPFLFFIEKWSPSCRPLYNKSLICGVLHGHMLFCKVLKEVCGDESPLCPWLLRLSGQPDLVAIFFHCRKTVAARGFLCPSFQIDWRQHSLSDPWTILSDLIAVLTLTLT